MTLEELREACAKAAEEWPVTESDRCALGALVRAIPLPAPVIEIVALRNRAAALEKALKLIAEHPHCSYEWRAGHPSLYDRQYEIGVADGHRCAAEAAKEALR